MDSIFIVRSDELKSRIDPFFFAYKNPILDGASVSIKENSEFVTQGPNPTDWVKESGISCLKTKNVYDDGLIIRNLDQISQSEYEKLKRFTLSKNDILITLKGFGSVGKVSRFDIDETAIFTREIGAIRLKKDSKIRPEYLEIYLKTSIGKSELLRGVTGATGQLTLTTSYIKELSIPLITLEKQDEIIQFAKESLAKKRRLQKEYDSILKNLNEFIEESLGIKIETLSSRQSYIINSEQLMGIRNRYIRTRFAQNSIKPKSIILKRTIAS